MTAHNLSFMDTQPEKTVRGHRPRLQWAADFKLIHYDKNSHACGWSSQVISLRAAADNSPTPTIHRRIRRAGAFVVCKGAAETDSRPGDD